MPPTETRPRVHHRLLEFFAWAGTVAIVLAYFLVSFRRLGPDSLWYIGLNIGGSLAIVVHSLQKRDLQPAILNIVWLLIALVALVRLF